MTTIALEEDAPQALAWGGDDDPLRTMLPRLGTAAGGEDVTENPPVRILGGIP